MQSQINTWHDINLHADNATKEFEEQEGVREKVI